MSKNVRHEKFHGIVFERNSLSSTNESTRFCIVGNVNTNITDNNFLIQIAYLQLRISYVVLAEISRSFCK